MSLYVSHYNLCRVHEALTPSAKHQTTPAMGLRPTRGRLATYWTRALAVAPADPTTTAPERRKRFRVIQGSKE